MTTWTSGYVADIGYTYGYYNELNPQRVRLAFLNAGLVCPEFGSACELGFGQGDLNLGLAIGVPGLESVKNGPLSDQGSASRRERIAVYLVRYWVNGKSAVKKISGAGIDCGQEPAHRSEAVRLGSAHIVGRLPHAKLVGKGLVYACLQAVRIRARGRLRP